MGKALDVIGQRFNRLVVIGRSERHSDAGALWVCQCDCGGEAVTTSLKLRSGHTQSCGCHRREVRTNLQHGHANKSRTYKSWKEMRQRCMNPNSDKWKWYGGRGISIAPEWDDFERFLSDMGERPERMTLDRLDANGNYCKKNCRWATGREQSLNKTNTRWLSMFGETKTLVDWSEDPRCVTTPGNFRSRIHNGQDPEDAFTRKARRSPIASRCLGT